MAEISIKWMCSKAVRPWIKECETEKKLIMRSEKAASCIYNFIYFISATSWGYYILKDEEYLPWSLGGKGDFKLAFTDKNWNYPTHPKGLAEYALVTMGYHVGGLVAHFYEPRKNDFVEMGLHHIVAFYLFGGCYLTNALECGMTIAFLHDIADVTTNLVKFVAETKYDNAAAAIFVVHMSIWGWTRIYALPFEYIYGVYLYCPVFSWWIVKPMFIYLLSCMALLHYFWYYLFIKMLTRFIKSGEAED